MPKITFIDRPCGTGKTTALINELQEWYADTHLPVLVVTPRLSEVQRIIDDAPQANLIQPEGASKTVDVEDLLKARRNIACTHALYVKLESLALRGLLTNYRLVIDECPTPLEAMPGISKINFEQHLLRGGLVTVDPVTSQVRPEPEWFDRVLMGSAGAYSNLFQYARVGRLVLAEDGRPAILAIPTALLSEPSTLTILTYLTEGSLIAAYLERIGQPYDVQKWEHEAEWIQKQRDLITIKTFDLPMVTRKAGRGTRTEPMKLTHSGQTKRLNGATAKALGSKLRKMFYDGDLKGSRKEDIMVTCAAQVWFAKGAEDRKHAGPVVSKTGLFGKWSNDGVRWHVTGGFQWVANQTRGVNDYINCHTAIFLYDQYPNPTICSYLKRDEREWGEQFALTEFVQWLYRSRVRVGEPITVYVPSDRMRRIFENWLNGTEDAA